jgi:hypothetical protein
MAASAAALEAFAWAASLRKAGGAGVRLGATLFGGLGTGAFPAFSGGGLDRQSLQCGVVLSSRVLIGPPKNEVRLHRGVKAQYPRILIDI